MLGERRQGASVTRFHYSLAQAIPLQCFTVLQAQAKQILGWLGIFFRQNVIQAVIIIVIISDNLILSAFRLNLATSLLNKEIFIL